MHSTASKFANYRSIHPTFSERVGGGSKAKTLQDQVTKINFACVVNLVGLILLVLQRICKQEVKT